MTAHGSWRGVATGRADVWTLITTRYGLAVGLGVTLVLVPILYAALASSKPGVALILASVSGLAAFLFGTLLVWPVERKITWQRQAEVLGYRVLAALAAYVLVGFVSLWAFNTFTERIVPLAWPSDFLRRVPFWPFYSLVILSCQGLLPAPPNACG